jgi:hypothetical protein
MAEHGNHCPACGGRLRIRTSRWLCKLREARRECACGYADVATIRPAEILSVRVVDTTHERAKQITDSLLFKKGNRHEEEKQTAHRTEPIGGRASATTG